MTVHKTVLEGGERKNKKVGVGVVKMRKEGIEVSVRRQRKVC